MSIELNGRTYTHKDPYGRLVRIISTDRVDSGDYLIAGWYQTPDGEPGEGLRPYRSEDLTPLPVKKRGFVTIYSYTGQRAGIVADGGRVYDTYETAAERNSGYLAIAPIEWEELA